MSVSLGTFGDDGEGQCSLQEGGGIGQNERSYGGDLCEQENLSVPHFVSSPERLLPTFPVLLQSLLLLEFQRGKKTKGFFSVQLF